MANTGDRQYSVAVETVLENYRALENYLTARYGNHPGLDNLQQIADAAKSLDPRDRIPIEAVSKNMNELARFLDEPNLGLRVSRHSSPASLLPFQFVIQGQFEFLQVMQVLQRYIAIATEVVHSNVVISPDALVLEMIPNSPETISLHQYEGGVGIIMKILDYMNGPKPIAIHFVHDKVEDEPGIHRKILGLEPEFGKSVTAIHFSPDTMHMILGEGNREDTVNSISQMESRRRKLYQDETTTDRVRFLLSHMLSLGEPRRQQLASLLGMSVRTFQRRLEEEGTTFNDLLRDLRIELAQQHLEDNIFSCNEIAFLLGYKDTSQFYKSFRKWCDISPAQYRQNHLASD